MPTKNNEEFIASLKRKEEEDLIRYLAQKRGLPYLDLTRADIEVDALYLMPESAAREAGIAVIKRTGKNLNVAVSNPDTKKTEEALEDLKKQKFSLEICLVSPRSLAVAWERYREGGISAPIEQGVIRLGNPVSTWKRGFQVESSSFPDELAKLAHATNIHQVSRIFELLLLWALHEEASDLHIEPEEKTAKIRLRLDGILYDIASLPYAVFKLLVSRIKLISELKLNIHERAQEGRFTIRTQKGDIETRTSLVPGAYGESIVLRILHPRTIAIELNELGMHPLVSAAMEEEIKKPNGMILTTGPTGSGKTTTLYAFLKHVRSPEIKIITIEDPVEYHLEGITQTQVDTGKNYHFANGLAALLRQDPDVIMVGEIRDLETAQTALHAALTGHLVFSTLHTNNAPGTIPRLIDLGVKPNIIAPAINVAMAQRLVRRLCETCKTKKEATPEESAFIKEAIDGMPQPYRPSFTPASPMLRRASRASEGKPSHQTDSFILYEANEKSSCASCGGRGWKGRIGVFEVFRIDDEIEKLILREPSEAMIRGEAVKQGMLALREDGILKVLQGITSLEELKRVAG